MHFPAINQIKSKYSVRHLSNFCAVAFTGLCKRLLTKMIGGAFVCRCKSILMDGDGMWYMVSAYQKPSSKVLFPMANIYYVHLRCEWMKCGWMFFCLLVISFALVLFWWSYVWKSLSLVWNVFDNFPLCWWLTDRWWTDNWWLLFRG